MHLALSFDSCKCYTADCLRRQINKALKSVLIDMRENAMKILTWMRCAMPNPEDVDDMWLNTGNMATAVVRFSTDQIDVVAGYHSTRTANVLQVCRVM